jgi:hypothetical protein
VAFSFDVGPFVTAELPGSPRSLAHLRLAVCDGELERQERYLVGLSTAREVALRAVRLAKVKRIDVLIQRVEARQKLLKTARKRLDYWVATEAYVRSQPGRVFQFEDWRIIVAELLQAEGQLAELYIKRVRLPEAAKRLPLGTYDDSALADVEKAIAADERSWFPRVEDALRYLIFIGIVRIDDYKVVHI